MAALVFDVSGVYLQSMTLTANDTLALTGGVDGQQVVLEVIQDSIGGRTLTAANSSIVGLLVPNPAANAASYQVLLYNAVANVWFPLPMSIGAGSGVQATYTASGAVTVQPGLILIGGSGADALTLAQPTSGAQDGLTMQFSVITAHAHTITTASSTGINGTNHVITFAASGDAVILKASGGIWYRIAGAGTNTLS